MSFALLAIHAGLLAWGALVHAPAVDEVGHMVAGLSHWRFGRFDLYRVNPPLVRLVATLPVALASPKTDWSTYTIPVQNDRPEFGIGDRFIAINGARSAWYFSLARLACIPFSLLGGLICRRWASDLAGAQAGLLALALWSFCPHILANGQMITPDVGSASLGLAVSYVFWRWLRRPGWPEALVTGIALGLALLARTTWLVLFALWPVLYALRVALIRDHVTARIHVLRVVQLGAIFVIGVYLVNFGYIFEGSFRPLREFCFVSEALRGRQNAEAPSPRVGNRFDGTWLGALPVPFPADFVAGIDYQKREFESGGSSYLRGRWQRRGWWYYYLYALGVKTPLGTLVLLGLAALPRHDRRRTRTRGELLDQSALLLPPLAILVVVSSQSGLSAHSRYVLPMLPFLYTWIGAAGRRLWSRSHFRPIIALALCWSILSTLSALPHSHAYFNESAGGSIGGRSHLVDSNIDWGQDLSFLKDWLDRHPEAHPLNLAYFGGFDPRSYGIRFRIPPSARDEPSETFDAEWFAISTTVLQGLQCPIPDGRGGRVTIEQGSYTYFQHCRPVSILGGSIYLYRLSASEIDHLRSGLYLREE